MACLLKGARPDRLFHAVNDQGKAAERKCCILGAFELDSLGQAVWPDVLIFIVISLLSRCQLPQMVLVIACLHEPQGPYWLPLAVSTEAGLHLAIEALQPQSLFCDDLGQTECPAIPSETESKPATLLPNSRNGT